MSETVAIDLPPEPESARRARKQLEAFRASLDEVSFVDLCLLVDELVVEALRDRNGATGEPIELRAERDGDRVRVAIAEGGGAFQLPSRRPEPGDPGVKLVQEWFERWNRGDRDFSRAEVLHPDFQIISRYQGESFRGLKGLRRWMQETESQEWKVVVDEWRDTDDLVVALGRVQLRGKESDVALEQPSGWLFEFQDGKLFRFRTFAQQRQALEAAGFSE